MTEAWEAYQVRSLINLPIFEKGEFVALFLVQRSVPTRWLPEEVDYIRNVADRIRVAIERSRVEQRLREFAASLERQVADRTRERDRAWRVSRDLLGVADAEGVWRSINPAWTDILGWQDSDIIGRNSAWFSHPDNTRPSPTDLARAPQVSHHYEGRYRGRDGAWHWLAWTVVPDDGELYCVGRDVTAEREQAAALAEAEAQLRQAQKMEAVGQLTGGLAHDFSNLLAGITGSLELMQARISQGRVAEAARFVTAAQSAAQRAAALTHRLLAFSRRQTLDPKPTSVNKLISGMEDLIRRTVGPAITLEVVGAAGLWITLCDPNQLENALLNLCINARDAMPNGGRLTIETANASLDDHAARTRELAPGQYVALCVTDTGVGMTPDLVDHVFEPFFTTKPIGQGTGLGLSMVYGFVKQSGGQVRLYSEPRRGTTVKLYLPRHIGGEAEDELPPAASETAPGARPEQTALVVDDEPTVLMLVSEVLRDLGYATLEAPDGPAALRFLRSDARLDLMVTDVGLPGGMNGRQLADAALAARPGLKILFITGYAENAALGNGHVGPGMHVMTKPFAIDALVAKVREITK
jgi:PAS domain S-box-containing protein